MAIPNAFPTATPLFNPKPFLSASTGAQTFFTAPAGVEAQKAAPLPGVTPVVNGGYTGATQAQRDVQRFTNLRNLVNQGVAIDPLAMRDLLDYEASQAKAVETQAKSKFFDAAASGAMRGATLGVAAGAGRKTAESLPGVYFSTQDARLPPGVSTVFDSPDTSAIGSQAQYRPKQGGGGILGKVGDVVNDVAPYNLAGIALSQITGGAPLDIASTLNIPYVDPLLEKRQRWIEGVTEADVPYYSDYARETVRPAVRKAVPGPKIAGDIAAALVPTQTGEIALEGAPGLSTTRGLVGAGRATARGASAGVGKALVGALDPTAATAIGGGGRKTGNVATDVLNAQVEEAAKAGNIRLDKYPEDIRGTIKTWADENPDVVQAARRGVIPDSEVQAAAKQLVEEHGGDFAKLQKRWKPGEAWNAEEITAIRGTLNAKTQAVMEAAKVARLDDTTENQLRLLAALQDQARVQEIVHGVTAEAGRGLRAFRQQVDNALASKDLDAMQTMLKRLMAGMDQDKLDNVAATLAKTDLEDPAAVSRLIRDLQKPTLWDYVMEVRINAMLSGPLTHIRNNLSNTAFAIMSPAERGLAAAVDVPLARLQGRARARFFEEVPADIFGAIHGIPEGARGALNILKYGFNPNDIGRLEYRRQAFRGVLGRIVRGPGTMLEAADAMGYGVNYRAALNVGALRQARTEGLKGTALQNRIADLLANPTEKLIKGAANTAEYRLFRGEPGALAKGIMNLRQHYKPLQIIFPFLKTPANLLGAGLERSPAGLLNPSLWRNLAAKNPEASDQIARVIMGSTIAAGVATGVATGKIDLTAAAPSLESARDRFYREGKLPFSIKIGDQWIQFQRLEPLNTTLAALAGTIQAVRDGSDPTAAASEAVTTIIRNFSDQTYMTGLSDLMDAIDDPGRYGERFVQSLATSFIPNLSRQAASINDPTVRDPQSLLERAKLSIPGMTDEVPAKLDAFGREQQRATPYSPVNVSAERQTPVDAELETLGMEIGFVGDSIGGVKLSRERQYEYQREAGQQLFNDLEELFSLPAYQEASQADKEKAVERLISASRADVRERLSEFWNLEAEKELESVGAQ